MLTLLTNVPIVRAMGKGRSRLSVKVSKEVYDKIILSDSLAWPWKWAARNCDVPPIMERKTL